MTVNNDDASDIDVPDKGDLIIRDGFPALYNPNSTSFQIMSDGDEPLPRHVFWSSENTFLFDDPERLRNLQDDCETVFTAREKPDGATYSAGQTYFLPANMKPRCALEAMAMKIFHEHTKHLKEGTFNPAQSGANWWTLVMDAAAETTNRGTDIYKKENGKEGKTGCTSSASASAPTSSFAEVGKIKINDNGVNSDDEDEEEEDEVGLHFDADYELEEQTGNILLHPRVATVTYLSDFGAPTFVLDQKSPPMNDSKKKTLEDGISTAWLSHPERGKHTAFDGRFLHGAPALYFPGRKSKNNKIVNCDEGSKEPATKRRKIISENQKRYTLLVNIWLNHWVMDAALLDEEVCVALKTPWEDDESSNLKKGDSNYRPPFVWNKDVDLSKPGKICCTSLSPSSIDPAGEDEIALCNHNVTVKYNPLMNECHAASYLGSTVKLELDENTITLYVGAELCADENEND